MQGKSNLDLASSRKFKLFNTSFNLGQKVGEKLTKLSNIGFSMECFTADMSKCQNLAFGWTPGYLLSNSSISVIFWKFPNFIRS